MLTFIDFSAYLHISWDKVSKTESTAQSIMIVTRLRFTSFSSSYLTIFCLSSVRIRVHIYLLLNRSSRFSCLELDEVSVTDLMHLASFTFFDLLLLFIEKIECSSFLSNSFIFSIYYFFILFVSSFTIWFELFVMNLAIKFYSFFTSL